jgi:AraC family transcriptional regulator
MTPLLPKIDRPFGLAETHGILARDGVADQVRSDGLGWRSLWISSQSEQPFRGSFTAKDPLLVFHRRPIVGYVDLHRRRQVLAPAGSVRFVAPDIDFDVELAEPTETVHVYLRKQIWDDVALDLTGDTRPIPFESRLVDAEPLLFALCKAGVASVDAHNEGSLFSDYLAQSMAAHILRAHLGIEPKRRRSETGAVLSPAVVRAMEYIEANLERAIGMEELARVACRSASQLTRVFASEVGMPPHRFHIQARVKRAQWLLAETTLPIAEIALECGFSHQEHLTRTFQRDLQTTPAAYRRSRRS